MIKFGINTHFSCIAESLHSGQHWNLKLVTVIKRCHEWCEFRWKHVICSKIKDKWVVRRSKALCILFYNTSICFLTIAFTLPLKFVFPSWRYQGWTIKFQDYLEDIRYIEEILYGKRNLRPKKLFAIRRCPLFTIRFKEVFRQEFDRILFRS